MISKLPSKNTVKEKSIEDSVQSEQKTMSSNIITDSGIDISNISGIDHNTDESFQSDDQFFESSNKENTFSKVSDITIHSQNSITDDNETEISTFLTSFNAKFNSKAKELFDILEIVDILVKDKNKSKTFSKDNDYKEKLMQCQNENDKLINQNEELQNKTATLEHQVETLKATNDALSSQNSSLLKDFNNLQQALNSIHEMMETQLEDIKLLGTQRSNLFEITKKQDSMIEYYENLVNKLKKNQSDLQKDDKEVIKKNNDNVELNSLFSKINNSLEEIKDKKFQIELTSINNSQIPINEKIIHMFDKLKTKINNKYEEKDKFINDSKEKEKAVTEYKQKCNELLSLFEEELNFLQTLTHSTDLQAAVFTNSNNSNESIFLKEESKVELIKRCANLGKYIEETIGQISQEKIDEQFPSTSYVDSTQIFNLLQSSQIEDRIQNIYKRFDFQNNVEERELFDMLCAQIYINDLLKNYTSELNMRITQYGNEISDLRQESNNEKNLISDKSLKKLIKQMKYIDTKIRKFVGNYIEINDDETTYKIVVDLFNTITEEFKNNQKTFSEKEEMEKEIKRLKKSISKLQRNYDGTEYKKLESLQTELKKANKHLIRKTEEFENLQKEIKEKDNTIIQFKKQIDDDDIKNKDYKERLESSANQINALNKQIKDFEITFSNVKKQRKQLGNQILKLQITNKQLNESVQKNNFQIRDEYERKIKTILEKQEKLEIENENYYQENQALISKNQQLSSELSTLNITKKSFEIKMKALDEKINLEKKHLQSKSIAQTTVIQIEQLQQINDLKYKIEEIVTRISKYLNDDCPKDIDSVILLAEEELKNMHNIRSQYNELLQDVSNSKQLLDIKPTTSITDTIKIFLEMQETKQKENCEIQKKIQQERKEYEQMKREIKKSEMQFVSLKQWESWGRRIYKVVYESESIKLDYNQLRLALEEALLSSVSNRLFFYRTNSLRTQKLFFLKFDKRLLTNRQPNCFNLSTIIAVCLFTRRVQKMCGFTAISPSQIEANIAQKRKQKDNSQYHYQPCKKLIRPLLN